MPQRTKQSCEPLWLGATDELDSTRSHNEHHAGAVLRSHVRAMVGQVSGVDFLPLLILASAVPRCLSLRCSLLKETCCVQEHVPLTEPNHLQRALRTLKTRGRSE